MGNYLGATSVSYCGTSEPCQISLSFPVAEVAGDVVAPKYGDLQAVIIPPDVPLTSLLTPEQIYGAKLNTLITARYGNWPADKIKVIYDLTEAIANNPRVNKDNIEMIVKAIGVCLDHTDYPAEALQAFDILLNNPTFNLNVELPNLSYRLPEFLGASINTCMEGGNANVYLRYLFANLHDHDHLAAMSLIAIQNELGAFVIWTDKDKMWVEGLSTAIERSGHRGQEAFELYFSIGKKLARIGGGDAHIYEFADLYLSLLGKVLEKSQNSVDGLTVLNKVLSKPGFDIALLRQLNAELEIASDPAAVFSRYA